MEVMELVTEKLRGKNRRIVLPEGEDGRVLEAAFELAGEGVVLPILLGKKDVIQAKAKELGREVSDLEIIDITRDERREAFEKEYFELRNGKVTEEQAKERMEVGNYFATMLVYKGFADGMVSGAVGTTAETVRPALEIIKTREGSSKVSGAFLMTRGDEKYLMADCAINITSDAKTLAETAIISAETAELLGISPRIAMLSFSTKGSAKSPEVDKVREATEFVKEKRQDLVIDGEIQFDAAFVPEVGAKKAPGSVLCGKANVFIFPSLEAGNIGYKIAQRLGGFQAIGPVLQGLKKPVNDLSRGCCASEVVNLAKITALQSLIEE